MFMGRRFLTIRSIDLKRGGPPLCNFPFGEILSTSPVARLPQCSLSCPALRCYGFMVHQSQAVGVAEMSKGSNDDKEQRPLGVFAYGDHMLVRHWLGRNCMVSVV